MGIRKEKEREKEREKDERGEKRMLVIVARSFLCISTVGGDMMADGITEDMAVFSWAQCKPMDEGVMIRFFV